MRVKFLAQENKSLTLASHADVLRLVTRLRVPPHGEECMTSLRTSVWEASKPPKPFDLKTRVLNMRLPLAVFWVFTKMKYLLLTLHPGKG